LFIKRIEEAKKPNVFNFQSSPGLMPSVKLDLENEDHSKNASIEEAKPSQVDYMQGTVSSNNKKSEIEYKRESKTKTRFNDLDFLSMSQKVHEQQDYIDLLLGENNSLKVKNKGLESTNSKLVINWQTAESSLKSYHGVIKSLEMKLKETQSDAQYKLGELAELQEMLQKSENKRKAANEQMNDVESKLVILQRQVSKLTSQNSLQENEIKFLKNELESKDSQNLKLIKQLSTLEELLESEKNRYLTETLNHMQSKESLKSQIEELKVIQENLLSENSRLQTIAQSLQLERKRTPPAQSVRRSETWLDQKFFDEISREEAARWHARYFALEEELSSVKQQLEKSIKNDTYHKNQLAQKNSFIEKLEVIVENLENKGPFNGKDSKSRSTQGSEFFIKAAGEMIRNARETLACSVCFRHLIKGFVCVPCGHVACEDCARVCVSLCGNCAEKVQVVQVVTVVEKLADVFASHLNGLERLLDMISVDL
jgi:chromosome segregation ATPase